MKRALLASEALADDARVLVDQDRHGLLPRSGRDDLPGGVGQVGGDDQVQPALGEQLATLRRVGALDADDDRQVQAEVASGADDAFGDHVAAHDATEDIDEDRLDLRIVQDELEIYNDCGGVFMFLTKDVLNKVGYLNSEYGQYGFEHAGYSNRIYRAGFTYAPYQHLKDTKEYIFAMDYNIEHKSSIPEYKKAKLIEENRKVFINELQSPKIFYNFEE